MRLAHALLPGLEQINVGRGSIAICGGDLSRRCGREPGIKQSELFSLLFSAFVSVWLLTPNIWGEKRLERHDSGGSGTAQGTQNEQPVDKMWVSCARSRRSPRRFGATHGSDEMRAQACFQMPGSAKCKTLYVVFCQRRVIALCGLRDGRFDGTA